MDKFNKKEIIKDEIRSLIENGIFGPGERLPSIRKLAKKHNTSITPVAEAYNDLVAVDLIESRHGSGYYVSSLSNYSNLYENFQKTKRKSVENFELIDTVFSNYGQVAFNSKDDIKFPFGATSSHSGLYPCTEFNERLAKCLQSIPDTNYQQTLCDDMELRKELSRHMLELELISNIENISIVRSVSEGLSLAMRACAAPGSTVAIESPGHMGFYFLARVFDYNVIPVRSDPISGLDVGAFRNMLQSGERPAFLCLCSNFSNPTGALMPDENKKALTELCREYQIPIIEDDILAELSYNGKRPLPLKHFDNENVIYVSGFGKCLIPTGRIGYILAGKCESKVSFYKHLMTAYAYVPMQMALCSFLRSGMADKCIQFYKNYLARIVSAYREIMLENFPEGTTVSDPKGGIYLWVTLPENLDFDSFVNLSRQHGISIAPGNNFDITNSFGHSFRFNCAAMPASTQSYEAVRMMCRAACKLCGQG